MDIYLGKISQLPSNLVLEPNNIYIVFLSITPFLDLIVWQEIPQFPCHTFEQKNSVLLSTHQTFHTVVLLHVTYFEASKHNNCSISLVFLQESYPLSLTLAQIPSGTRFHLAHFSLSDFFVAWTDLQISDQNMSRHQSFCHPQCSGNLSF